MHICFLTNEYPHPDIGTSGGIGTSIRNLARQLVRMGHRVTVLGWHEKEIEVNDQGVYIHLLPATRVPRLGWLLNRKRLQDEVNRMVRQEGLDIVEAPDWGGISAGMRLRCPLVIRCHGSDTYFGHLLGYRPRWKVYIAERLALLGADDVAAVSRFGAEVTRKIFNLKREIRVIHNGVDMDEFKPADPKEVEPHTILYFGTLVRKKGVLDLMHIFNRVVAAIPDAKLVLLGRDAVDRETGRSTWSLCQEILTQQAKAKVKWEGAVTYSEVRRWIARAEVCVFPSYAECLPLSWIEAMAMGKAVVASSIGWAREIIEDGVSGSLVHPSDHARYAEAIVELMRDSDKRRGFEQKARENAEKLFSIKTVASTTLRWYQTLL